MALLCSWRSLPHSGRCTAATALSAGWVASTLGISSTGLAPFLVPKVRATGSNRYLSLGSKTCTVPRHPKRFTARPAFFAL